jgi:N-methylhydantoinase A
MVLDAARKRGIPSSASFEVLPEHREYERTSTTALNAYVAPVVERYLSRLSDGLKSRGTSSLRIMQSNGGSARAGAAASLAVRTVLSGPAGGVAGAFQVAKAAGFDRIITLDMGGTSTDVCLCDGSVPFTSESTIDGMPLRIPTVDVHTVGAGGGSIARIDAGGALRVGPESAGADPGPACYGKGTQPTVTDAHLVLGRLRPDRFLGGRMELSGAAAKRALRPLARSFGGDVQEAARSIVRVADASMERALRVISVERGHDPRRFTLVAFGGAGPLHACQLAESLGVPRVLIPLFPGVLSAFGMAAAPVTVDHVQALLSTVDASAAFQRRLDRVIKRLESRARRELASQGYTKRVRIAKALDLRYAGQSYELTVPITSTNPAQFTKTFHSMHRRRYGHSDPSRAAEVVSVRVRGEAPGAAVRPPALPRRKSSAQAARIERMPVRFDRDRQTWLYERSELRAGDRLRGPAIALQLDATTVVPPGWHGRVDRIGNLVLETAQ